MSTTAMWLLLAVVVIVILFASVLYKRTFTVHELALTGVMAALSLVAYLFFRVPFYGGSSFHLGKGQQHRAAVHVEEHPVDRLDLDGGRVDVAHLGQAPAGRVVCLLLRGQGLLQLLGYRASKTS